MAKYRFYDFTKPLDHILLKYFGTTDPFKMPFAKSTTREKSYYSKTGDVNIQAGRFLLEQDIDQMRDKLLSESEKRLPLLEKLAYQK